MNKFGHLPKLSAVAASILLVATQTLLAEDPSRAKELAVRGWKAFEAGRLLEAKKALLEATKIDPSNASYAMALGQVYLSSGSPKLAIPQLQKALSALPGDFDVRYTLAQAYQKTDDDVRALKFLEGDLPPEPLRGPWRFSQGFSLFRLGRPDAAEPVFRELLSDEKMQAPASFFIANCYFAQSQYEQAVRYYKQAIAVGNVPDNRGLNAYYYNCGLTLYQLQRFAEAAEAFRNSIQRYSKDPLPWLFLGRCETELGRFQQAIAAFESSIKANPKFRLAYFQLARLQVQHGDKQRAEELFQKVEELRKQELQQEEELARRLKLTSH